MKFIKEWIERRKGRKEFHKMFDGVIEKMKGMLLFEPNTKEVHSHAEDVIKDMLLENGCSNVTVSIFADPKNINICKANIKLVHHGEAYGIDMKFLPTEIER